MIMDTDISLETLAKTFPAEIIEAVRVLTHSKGEPYPEYITRVKANPLARKVKLADLRHNSDQTRMENADEATLAYFREKYRKAFEILE